jgi:hypothetical protein
METNKRHGMNSSQVINHVNIELVSNISESVCISIIKG